MFSRVRKTSNSPKYSTCGVSRLNRVFVFGHSQKWDRSSWGLAISLVEVDRPNEMQIPVYADLGEWRGKTCPLL